LPLISYGGSATITTLAALGLVQSVMLRRRAVAHVMGSPRTHGVASEFVG
jgi:cell division protein FtsW (lipid II flippase)